MRAILYSVIFLFLLAPPPVQANDRLVRVYAPDALVDSGLFKYILPRFTLKTQVRIEFVETDEADMIFGEAGDPVFEGAGAVWRLAVANTEHPGAQRFADWLFSGVGQGAITSYAPEGVAMFTLPEIDAEAEIVVELTGDAVWGKEISRDKCGRCHVTERARLLSGIGSTPSFFVMRSFSDWEDRFAAFFALKPHPAFTQIEDVTEPFPDDRPSPIAPISMTLEEVDAVLAYVAGLQAADLGAPLKHQ